MKFNIMLRYYVDIVVDAKDNGEKEWAAWPPAFRRDDAEHFGYGPTPLIAAMRCFCASKLGDEVEILPELI